MECPACATQIPDTAKQCEHCGWEAPRSGLAVAGIVLLAVLGLGCLGFVLLGLVVALVVPTHNHDRKGGNEAAAIGALKTLSMAQALYREGDKDGDEVFDYGTLSELSETTLIDGILGSGTKQGYLFTCQPVATTPEFLWTATATPAVPGTTGVRYFGTNHTGVIYVSRTAPVRFDAEGEVLGDAVPLGN